MASTASAQIIYSGPNQNIKAGPIATPSPSFTHPAYLKVGHGLATGVHTGPGYISANKFVSFGPGFFSIGVGQGFNYSGSFYAIAGVGGLGNVGFLNTGCGCFVNKLNAGDLISQNAGIFERFFRTAIVEQFIPKITQGSCTVNSTCLPAAAGQKLHGGKQSIAWAASQTGFAGFSFTNNGQTDFGWVRLIYTTGNNGAPNSITAVDWAYDAGGNAIQAGETQSPVPEPATGALAILAAGAAGVTALRRRKLKTDA